MELCAYGSKVLETPASDITDFSDKKNLVVDMIDIMHEKNGVGLAAPQVGVSIRLFVFDDQAGFAGHIFNPFLMGGARKELLHEGCLSLPGLYLNDVRRSTKAIVSGLDLRGKPISYNVSGFAAQIMQHEVDHLDGILFIERAIGSLQLINDWKSSLEN